MYHREIRRQRKLDHRISRANGYAVSPPRRARDSESLTPPRHGPGPSTFSRVDEDEDEDEEAEAEAEAENRERMAFLEQEEMDRLESNPFASYSFPDFPAHVHIPKRFRPTLSGPSWPSGFGFGSGAGEGLRDAMRELRGATTAPALGNMDDDEYTTFIRQGMDRLRNLAEADERHTRERERQRRAEERLRREEASERRRQERRERRRERQGARARSTANANTNAGASASAYARDTPEWMRPPPGWGRQHVYGHGHGQADDDIVQILRDSKSLERERYINLWASLAGEIQQVEMRYHDIPWPTYGGKSLSLEKADVRSFLFDLAGDKTKGSAGQAASTAKDREKKVLRDAIRIFHPDRFFGRFLDRVRESDRDRVREGVEKCSRIINDLAAENAAR